MRVDASGLPIVGRRLVCILGCVALAGCTVAARDSESAPVQSLSKASNTPAAAQHAELGTPAASPEAGALELAGDLRPDQAADLAFKIGGQLVSVKVERGQKVKKGQLLAALGDNEARAQLAQTEAAVSQAQAQLSLARDNETRAATLVAANAAPGSQATAVRLQADTAQAALLQAQATRDLATAALANHQLKAPFDGEIVKVPDGLGQIVAPGAPLLRLEDLDQLVLRTTVSEADLDRIKVGDEVVIEASNGRKVTGKVKVVLRSLEPASRRAPIEVRVANPDRVLVAGSYVRAMHKAR